MIDDWIGLDWIGLDWIGLDWIGLDWIGLDWIGLDWIAEAAFPFLPREVVGFELLRRIMIYDMIFGGADYAPR